MENFINYIIANKTLLTYNANSSIEGDKENGTTTGLASVNMSSMNIVPGSRSAASFGPYPISAGDMLRRNGRKEELANPGIIKFDKKITTE